MKKIFISLFFMISVISFLSLTVTAAEEKKGKGESKGELLDNLDLAEAWVTANGDGTTIEVASIKGKEGNAIEIKYDLADTKQWVGIHNTFDLQVAKGDYFKFWVKGDGAANNVEFKAVDADGSNYTKAFDGATKKSDWTAIVVPVANLQYGWGGDRKLDQIVEIWISVIFKDGKKGTLCIDNLEYYKK